MTNELSRSIKHIIYCITTVFLLLPVKLWSQQSYVIDMSPIDGMPVTPDNVFSYRIQTNVAGKVTIKGSIRYRGNNQSITYSFDYQLQSGMNTIDADVVHPQWQFSSSALRELFLENKTLPAGTYEYCVSILPPNHGAEVKSGVYSECTYQKAGTFFLINLVDPADKAKLQEFNPLLSWVANSSLSSQLTYRIRVAEIKERQNAQTAVMRNQPMYDEKSLMSNTLVYPVFAKPLQENKPYAWTVDAYYKDILLGNSETWQFIIPKDTPKTKAPATRSYIDIKRENATASLVIMGEMKLKYQLDKYRKDLLLLKLVDEAKDEVALRPNSVKVDYGDNRFILNLKDSSNLKHYKNYKLLITTQSGDNYELPFKYVNPDFVH